MVEADRIEGSPAANRGTTAGGTTPAPARPLLEVRDLSVAFPAGRGQERRIVRDLSYTLLPGETLGVVGESGCGKTVTSLALLGLVAPPGRVSGAIEMDGRNLLDQHARAWRSMRGRDIAMIFQEPMSAMNPVMTVGRQIGEVIVEHERVSSREAAERAVHLLDAVGIPAPAQRARDYPHQLSGGMRQRAMIAMALACHPRLLIADEPTTALDVTIQAQILDLILRLQEENGMAVQFISHNLAVVSEVAHRILVMYAGRGVELGAADAIFARPLHPYTRGLISTLPSPDEKVARLREIPGSIRLLPDHGCRFAARCPLASEICREAEPEFREIEPGHFAACVKADA
ncbi:MAG: ABC transporter ATP-binding protein [Sphingomonas sp.]